MRDNSNINEEIENLEYLIAALSVRVANLKDLVQSSDPNATTAGPARATSGGVAQRVRSAARAVTGRKYSEADFVQQFRLNDRVIITNKYKGLQGTEGQVFKLDFPWVHFRTDSGEEIYRKYSNVTVIKDRA